ncbi:MAG: RNA polymerase sigma-70 factor [Pedobacter sp.]|nr:MAG: RNA polymerase sigma-70 factor [Pedobacter sp.]
MENQYAGESESTLLIKIKKNNYSAFEELYDRHFDSLYGYAYNIIREHADAQDIIQDIFVWFWEHRHEWNLTSSKGYLLTAVKFKTISYFRENKVRSDFYHKMAKRPNFEMDESLLLEVRELQELIRQITEQLPERCKQIFSLSRFEQVSNKEIALQLGISEKTVEAQITIALRKLKQKLRKASYLLFLLS